MRTLQYAAAIAFGLSSGLLSSIASAQDSATLKSFRDKSMIKIEYKAPSDKKLEPIYQRLKAREVLERLQEHAEPGGVLISESVHDVVRGTVGKLARDIGYLQLKNLDKSVRAYALTIDAPKIVVTYKNHGIARDSRMPKVTLFQIHRPLHHTSEQTVTLPRPKRQRKSLAELAEGSQGLRSPRRSDRSMVGRIADIGWSRAVFTWSWT